MPRLSVAVQAHKNPNCKDFPVKEMPLCTDVTLQINFYINTDAPLYGSLVKFEYLRHFVQVHLKLQTQECLVTSKKQIFRVICIKLHLKQHNIYTHCFLNEKIGILQNNVYDPRRLQKYFSVCYRGVFRTDQTSTLNSGFFQSNTRLKISPSLDLGVADKPTCNSKLAVQSSSIRALLLFCPPFILNGFPAKRHFLPEPCAMKRAQTFSWSRATKRGKAHKTSTTETLAKFSGLLRKAHNAR